MFQRFRLLAFISAMLFGFPMVTQATETGLFWQIKSPTGKVSYLFGTIHTDDNRVTDFSAPIKTALKSVDVFVMETTPNGDPHNFLMAEGSLKTMLTEEEMDQFRRLVDFHVMHLDRALKMKPWLLAVLFSQYKPQTPYAQDNLLMRSAEDFGKPVKGLESNAEHFGVIDSFSMDEQMVMLRAALKMDEAQKAHDFERLIAVYQQEDSDQLLALNAEVTEAGLPKTLSKKMLQKLLNDRNQLMANRSIAIANEQSTFIAVGAAHLPGESGLIKQFQQAGYTFTRIQK